MPGLALKARPWQRRGPTSRFGLPLPHSGAELCFDGANDFVAQFFDVGIGHSFFDALINERVGETLFACAELFAAIDIEELHVAEQCTASAFDGGGDIGGGNGVVDDDGEVLNDGGDARHIAHLAILSAGGGVAGMLPVMAVAYATMLRSWVGAVDDLAEHHDPAHTHRLSVLASIDEDNGDEDNSGGGMLDHDGGGEGGSGGAWSAAEAGGQALGGLSSPAAA